MSEYDSTYVFMPLAEAQLYFNSPDAAQAIEVYLDDPDQVGALRAAGRGGRRAARLLHRLAAAQRDVLHRAGGGAERHVPHPDADRARRGAEHHLRPHHAGEGQGPRHRHPAHHGRDAEARSCASSSSPARRSAPSARWSASLIGTIICANIESLRQFVSWMTQHRGVRAGALFPLDASRRDGSGARRPRSS